MKSKLLTVCMSALVLGGCTYGVEIGPIELPPSQNGNIQQLAKNTTALKNIYIQYQDGFNVKTAIADFEPKGTIPGVRSLLIPLDEDDSDLSALGFTTHISNDGTEAILQYNDSVVRFKVGDHSMFVNDKPGLQIADAPIYNNSTIYVPIIPILDALKIDYTAVGEDLTIGGRYTDDTGQPEFTGDTGTATNGEPTGTTSGEPAGNTGADAGTTGAGGATNTGTEPTGNTGADAGTGTNN